MARSKRAPRTGQVGDQAAGQRPTGARPKTGKALMSATVRRGKVWADDPSPLRDMTPAQRERRMVALLECAANYGDASAAREWLAHFRWRVEMKKGKPTQRTAGELGVQIHVVNRLGDAPPIGLGGAKATKAKVLAATQVVDSEGD